MEPSRTAHPTVDGFEARTDHIPSCLQTCGNEGSGSGEEAKKWERIINGVTPDVNSWPFLVRLFFSNEGQATGFICGGTVLR